jgi:hypothetical protein
MNKKDLFQNPLAGVQEAFSAAATYGTNLQQIKRLDTIEKKYQDISGAINDYNTEYNAMQSEGDYADLNGSYLAYLDKKSNVHDALKEDIETAIIQRNNAYVVGMITIGTVILTSYIIMKKY